jgi:long-chain acyl-CoA synthetase
MRLTHGLQQAALHHPQRTSTIFEQRRKSYGETAARVARLAAGLAGLGVRPGDRVAILALNSDRYYEAYYAILWAGGVAVPCNTRWSHAEHAAALRDCEPHLLIVDRNFVSAAPAFPGIPGGRILYMDDGEAPQGFADFEGLVAHSPAMDDNGRGGNELAGIFYTGGTTGVSKGVMLSHDGLIVNFMASTLLEPYCDDCVFLHSPPMFHLADGFLLFGLTLVCATHVIVPRFEPAAVVGAIRDQGINSLLLVPTMIGMLDRHLRETNEVLDTVQRLTYGASPISEALLKRAFVMFPKARICQLYGQTELSPVATLLTSEFHTAADSGPRRLRSAGRAIPGVELRIADAQLRALPPGEVGEILVRGPSVMLGYWRKPALTAETIVDGWLRTGDAGYLDAQGFLYLVDRVKDMIISGGENVYSAEVENVLAQHPAVEECAVIGVPDPRWGERVHAILRLRAGHDGSPEDLTAHCAGLIANYKCPRSFSFRSDPLPLSGTGKIQKSELRREYWTGTDRGVS